MSITAADIKSVVLVEDDFGHEIRVGNILTNVKYPEIYYEPTRVMRPDHGGTYIDHVTGKTRQFDYRCQIVRGREISRSIFLAVECKNLNPDLPLVVCGRPRTDEESYHIFIHLKIRPPNGSEFSLKKVDGFNSIYKPDAFVGKSLLRLKKKQNELCADGDSEIYDRWSQAMASCHDLAKRAFKDKPSPKSCAFIMPLVVVPDNSLWTVSYKSDGSLDGDPIQVDKCEFYVEQKLLLSDMPPVILTHIHFVTVKGLSQMLLDFVATRSRTWDAIFSEASSDIK